MRSHLIVNPVAGADAAAGYLPMINDRLRAAFGPLEITMTVGPGDATALARDAARAGSDRLFVAGGDGTLNEALNGVAQVPGALRAMTFGIVPLGTGNDFAAAIGMPADVAQAVDALVHGVPALVDVATLNDVYFVNVSAGGFIAEVSDAVTPRMKSLAGKLAYLIGGAQVVFEYKPLHARIDAGTGNGGGRAGARRQKDLPLQTFAVCNSPLVGGGRRIAPGARIDDGWLDVCLIQAMTTIDFIALLTRVSSGEHVDDARVEYFRARELRLAFDRVVTVNTDGQVLELTECRYAVLPRAARFLRPATV